MIKLIALDLDGTTLNNEGRLEEKTKIAIEKAIAKGIQVVIATGRVLSALPEDMLEIKGIRYAITSNGANVIDLKTKKSDYTNFIHEEAVEAVLETLRKYEFMTEVFTNGNAYIEETVYSSVQEKGSPFNNTAYLLATRKPIAGLFDYIFAHKNMIENINLNFINPKDKIMMKSVLGDIDGISVTSSFEYNLEICGLNTNKAEGLKKLCEKLGLSAKELMACGDSDNDIEMLKYVGMPVTVANAKEEVKSVVQYIAPSNDKSGVAVAIQDLVLQAKDCIG